MDTALINEIRNNDWFSNTIKKFGLNHITVLLIFIAINIGIDIILAIKFDAFYPKPHYQGLQNGYTIWIDDFIAQPIIISFFIWLQSAGSKLFKSLIDDDIINLNQSIDGEIIQLVKHLQNKWFYRFALLISIIVGFVHKTMYSVTPNSTSIADWGGIHPIIGWTRSIIFILIIYVMILIIFDLTLIIHTLNKIFSSFEINIKPYHPDKAGGLGEIGKFSANLGFLAAAIGLAFTATYFNAANVGGIFFFTWMTYNYIGIILYILIAPILFYLPIHSAHKAMLKSRRQLLHQLSIDFSATYDNMLLFLQNPEKMKSSLTRIEQIKQTYELTKDFVVWPINIGNIQKYFSLIIASISPLLINIFERIFTL